MPSAPSTDNYAIGKGILYIGEWSGTTPPTNPSGYSDMGNVTSIEVEPSVERQPHYSSRTGFRTKDKNPIIQSDYTVNFDADEICAANLNRYLMGSLSGTNVVQALQASDAEFALKFVSDNPLGPNQTWLFHRVTLSPNGPLALIGEDYMIMSFAGEGLSDVANNPSSPYITVTYVTTTTTT